MQEIVTSRDAVDYLVAQIVRESQLEGVALTEVERKMLYFSETEWTLPDIDEVSAEFERSFDESEYEQKIASLISSLVRRMKKDDPEALHTWNAAVHAIRDEDRYLLIHIDAANQLPGKQPSRSLFLLSMAFGAVAALLLIYLVL